MSLMLAVIHPSGLFYQQIKVEDVPEIVEKTVVGGQVIDRLLYRAPGSKTRLLWLLTALLKAAPFQNHL